jgi:hypothetical protein
VDAYIATGQPTAASSERKDGWIAGAKRFALSGVCRCEAKTSKRIVLCSILLAESTRRIEFVASHQIHVEQRAS